MKAKHTVPAKEDWSGYETDPDVRYFHKLAFGKTYDEILTYFEGGRSIDRADEILYSPRAIFQYYIYSFTEYLKSKLAVEDSDAASSFLRLLIAREDKDPGSVTQIYPNLRDTIEGSIPKK